MKWVGLGCLILVTSCIRDIPDLPDPFEGGFIRGRIVQRNPADGSLVPREGVRIRATSWSGSTVSGEDGSFRLRRIGLGAIMVAAELRDLTGAVVAGNYQNVVFETDGQLLDLGDVRIDRDATVYGRIVDATSTTATARSSIRGSIAAVLGTPFQAISDADEFRLRGIAPGTFDVAGYANNLVPGLMPEVPADPGRQVEIPDIELTEEATRPVLAEGLVLLEDGASPESVVIEMRPMQSPAEVSMASATADGRFQVSVLPGLYRVSFSKEGYVPLDIPNVLVLDGETRGLGQPFLAVAPPGDYDGDGVLDMMDMDPDNDGCAGATDAYPLDPRYCRDSDGDGLADEMDPDADGDGQPDLDQDCAADPDCDLDGDGGGPDTPLEVTGFAPQAVEVHSLLTVTGRGFGAREDTYAVFGGAREFADQVNVAGTQATFWIPEDATTGTFRVRSNEQTWTSTTSLVIIPNDEVISRVEPTEVTAGAILAIYANLSETVEVEVEFDRAGRFSPNATCTPTQLAAATGTDRVICVRAPSVGSVVRIYFNGSSDRAGITIVPGPVLTAIDPGIASAGVPVRFIGSGFNSLPEVQARFPGTSTLVSPNSRNSENMWFTVPTGAVSGNPSLVWDGGEIVSIGELAIDDQQTVISDIYPKYMVAGQGGVRVSGANLGEIVAVTLPGGVTATITDSTNRDLTFDVPSSYGGQTGDVNFLLADNSTRTSPFPVGAIVASRVIARSAASGYEKSVASSSPETAMTATAYDIWFHSSDGSSRSYPLPTGYRIAIASRGFGEKWRGGLIPGTDQAIATDGTDYILVGRQSSRPGPGCSFSVSDHQTSAILVSPDRRWAYFVRKVQSQPGIDVIAFNLQDQSCSVVENLATTWMLRGAPRFGPLLGADLVLLDFGSGSTAWTTMNIRPSDGIPDGQIGAVNDVGRLPSTTSGWRVWDVAGTDVIQLSSQESRRIVGGVAVRLELYDYMDEPEDVGGRYYIARQRGGSTSFQVPDGRMHCSLYDRVANRLVGYIERVDTEAILQECVGDVSTNHFVVIDRASSTYNYTFYEIIEP